MPIEYARLSEEHLEDLQKMLLPFWSRRWSRERAERFFRWRFLDRRDGEGLIAYDGGRPVGFVDSFLRPYRTRNGTRTVHEPAEWYSDPAYRPLLGMKLTRRLMDRSEPALTVGGNRHTASLLPRLGHRTLPDLATYALPTGLGSAVKGLSKALRFPLSSVPASVAGPLSLPARWSGAGHHWGGGGDTSNPGISVRRIPDEEPVPRPVVGDGDSLGSDGSVGSGAYGLAPILGEQDCRWFRRAPREVGCFRWLSFETFGGTAGVSFSRLFHDGPFVAARILHLEAAEPSTPFYLRMVEATVAELMKSEPQWIGARFSCPMSRRALEGAGFRQVGSCRAFWWDRERWVPEGPLHLSWASGDEPLLPYPH